MHETVRLGHALDFAHVSGESRLRFRARIREKRAVPEDPDRAIESHERVAGPEDRGAPAEARDVARGAVPFRAVPQELAARELDAIEIGQVVVDVEGVGDAEGGAREAAELAPGHVERRLLRRVERVGGRLRKDVVLERHEPASAFVDLPHEAGHRRRPEDELARNSRNDGAHEPAQIRHDEGDARGREEHPARRGPQEKEPGENDPARRRPEQYPGQAIRAQGGERRNGRPGAKRQTRDGLRFPRRHGGQNEKNERRGQRPDRTPPRSLLAQRVQEKAPEERAPELEPDGELLGIPQRKRRVPREKRFGEEEAGHRQNEGRRREGVDEDARAPGRPDAEKRGGGKRSRVQGREEAGRPAGPEPISPDDLIASEWKRHEELDEPPGRDRPRQRVLPGERRQGPRGRRVRQGGRQKLDRRDEEARDRRGAEPEKGREGASSFLQSQQQRAEECEAGGEDVAGEQIDSPDETEHGGRSRPRLSREPPRGPDNERQEGEPGHEVEVVDLPECGPAEGVRHCRHRRAETRDPEETRQQERAQARDGEMENGKELQREIERKRRQADTDRVEGAHVRIRSQGPAEGRLRHPQRHAPLAPGFVDGSLDRKEVARKVPAGKGAIREERVGEEEAEQCGETDPEEDSGPPPRGAGSQGASHGWERHRRPLRKEECIECTRSGGADHRISAGRRRAFDNIGACRIASR